MNNPQIGGQLSFNSVTPSAGGWGIDPSGSLNTGPSGITPSVGGWNINSSGSLAGGGLFSNIGHGINGLGSLGAGFFNALRNGFGSLTSGFGNMGGGGTNPTSGGWSVDSSGQLVNNSDSLIAGANATLASQGQSGGNSNNARQGPSPISHDTGIPGYASAFMGDIAKRNQI